MHEKMARRVNADRIEGEADRMRRGDVTHADLRTIARQMADADESAEDIAYAMEKPWKYADVLVAAEDSAAGRL